MAIIPEEAKYNIRLVWLSFLQALYSFPPLQRVVLVVGVIMLIPGYWITRVGAKTYYNYSYNKQLVAAHSSFTSAQTAQVAETKIFPLKTGGYIAYAKITNPNLDLAGFDIPYTFSIRNSRKEEVYTTTGHTFMLPGKEQYLMTTAFPGKDGATEASVSFGSIHWQKRFEIPTVKLTTPAVAFSDSSAGLRLEGSVINNSAYTLGNVRLTFLMYDNSGKLVGVTQRDESDIESRDRRSFPQVWPGSIMASEVSRIEPFAITNSLDVRNLKAGSTSSGGSSSTIQKADEGGD